jgi:hypothetical protein
MENMVLLLFNYFIYDRHYHSGDQLDKERFNKLNDVKWKYSQ